MNEYLMLFRNEKSDKNQQPSAEQMQTAVQQWQTWIRSLVTKGRYSGTNRLLPEGKTIKPGNSVTDGPYAEVKEVVGGYLVVQAESIDEATDMAKSCPNLLYGGSVEVRSIMPIEYEPNSNNFLEPK